MPTFKEHFDKMVGLQHRLAVWTSLRDHLEENFASKDGCKAKMAMRVKNCPVEVVPEDIIEEVIQFLDENHIQEIRQEIARVEGLEIGSEPQPPAGGTN